MRMSTGTPLQTPFGEHSTADEVAAGVDLSGSRAIVTGASSGIGTETARVTRATESAHSSFSDFEGYVPSANSDRFYIEQSYIDLDIGFRGHGDCPGNANYGCLVSGTDPTKIGQPGGPLHLDVQYHHPFLQPAGYSFDIHGYVRSRCPCQ
jgi:hypothetical protein